MAIVLRYSFAQKLVQTSLKNWSTNTSQRANMDIPLATHIIGIWQGFKGYRRKSSTFRLQADVGGLSALTETFFEKTSKFWLRHEVKIYK